MLKACISMGKSCRRAERAFQCASTQEGRGIPSEGGGGEDEKITENAHDVSRSYFFLWNARSAAVEPLSAVARFHCNRVRATLSWYIYIYIDTYIYNLVYMCIVPSV